MSGHWCVDTATCIGCSVCSDTDPEVFGLDEDTGIAFAFHVPERLVRDRQDALDAEQDCPVEAIFWHDKDDDPEREPVCQHVTLKDRGSS